MIEESVPSLEQIGFDPFFAAQLQKLDGGLMPARIAIAHGESYIAWTLAGVRKAILVGHRETAWRTAARSPPGR